MSSQPGQNPRSGKPPLVLETPRLILRDFRLEDWERVHSYAALPDFSRYEMWGPNTVEDTKKYVGQVVAQVAEPDRYQFEFAACWKEDGLLIGGCGLCRESQESYVGNLGWAIHPFFQNQGLATEAARELVRFGFLQLGLKVIYATCDTRNAASARVMEKVGMRRVGHLKDHKIIKGKLRDSYRYEILADQPSKPD